MICEKLPLSCAPFMYKEHVQALAQSPPLKFLLVLVYESKHSFRSINTTHTSASALIRFFLTQGHVSASELMMQRELSQIARDSSGMGADGETAGPSTSQQVLMPPPSSTPGTR